MTTTENYNGKHYYVHVEADYHSNPGAYFRLGSYSSVEHEIKSDSKSVNNYYPIIYTPNAAATGLDENTTKAAQSELGIMLSCDGRILLKSHSIIAIDNDADISINTAGNLAANVAKNMTIVTEVAASITAGGDITLQTKNSKDIILNADGGNGYITQTGNKGLTTWGSLDWTMNEGDTYSMNKGNSITFTLSKSLDLKAGLSAEFSAAASFSLSMALSISLSPLSAKIDWSGITIKGSKSHIESDDFKLSFNSVAAQASAAEAEKKNIKAALNDLKVMKDELIAAQESLVVHETAISAQQGQIGAISRTLNMYV